MVVRHKYRGNAIIESNGVWYYVETGDPVATTRMPCARCKRERTREGHDACLGTLQGVMNACCGHGNDREAYVQFWDATIINGQDALFIMEILKRQRGECLRKIKKNMDTEESRLFWSYISQRNFAKSKELPRLGDSWWKAETELSASLLAIKERK